MHTNIASYLVHKAKQDPQQKAIIVTKGRDKQGAMLASHISYQELHQSSEDLARGLLMTGFQKGDRVVLMVPPSFELFILTFALFKAGLVPVFVDPGLGMKRMKSCLQQVKPQHFIGIPKAHLARVAFGLNSIPWRFLVTVGFPKFWGLSLASLQTKGRHSQTQLAPTVASDNAAILFTSGSTGRPKGALYTHSNFISQIEILRRELNIQDGEVDLCTFPLFALFAPAFGMTAVIPEMDFTRPAKVCPENIFQAIETFKVQNLFGSPALIKTVGAKGVAEGKTFPSLKRVISAGAPVSAEVIQTFRNCLPPDAQFFTPYGATEALPVALVESSEILSETQAKTLKGAGICVGRPVAGTDIKIIQISDSPITEWSESLSLPQGSIGEICVKGEQVSRSYFMQWDATAQAKIWLENRGPCFHRMGDLGYFDEQGRLWFCGRKSHRVTCQGQHNIYTIPGESIINSHAAVERSAIVGVGAGKNRRPVLCLQPKRTLDHPQQAQVKGEIEELCRQYPETVDIKDILFHKDFPVDVRHNSKIFRESLSKWAERRL